MSGAPLPPFGVTVGVTGHRGASVGRDAVAATGARVAAVLTAIMAKSEAVRARAADLFDPRPSERRLVSALAEGADTLTAELALGLGYRLEVLLPFARAVYAADFEDARDRAAFDALAGRASALLELPGRREAALDAYVEAGRAVIAHADLIIAVWDGEAARGRGGTAEIVEHALRRGLPVVHVPLQPERPVRILWSGYDHPPLEMIDFCDAPDRPWSDAALDAVLTRLLAPPGQPEEVASARLFLAERQRRVRPRVEYQLLLSLLFVRRIRRQHMRVAPYADTTEAEWRAFHRGCAGAQHGVAGGFKELERAYCWSDRLADHYASAYRSGHVANFVLAAVAIMLALAGLLAPKEKQLLVGAELGVILLFILNTRVGTRRGWHRRWLDYRQLAEQLRPMRSLKLFAFARPPREDHQIEPRRWMDWYAGAFWRAMGCPDGKLDAGTLATLTRLTLDEELAPQLGYHQANAHRMHQVEHRLHAAANVLFALTMLSLVAFLVVYLGDHDLASRYGTWLAVLTAGLPALGASLHGIREQGEFLRTARRSTATASMLGMITRDLGGAPLPLTRASTLVEGAARAMLNDVGQWRQSYEMRNLALP